MIVVKKKSSLSKTRLKLQDKSGSSSGVEQMSDKVVHLWANYAPMLVGTLKNIGLPAPNEQLRIISTKCFNAIAFVDFIRQKEEILETYLAIYSIDFETGLLVDTMAKNGQLGKTTFLISNLKNSAYRKKDAVIRELFLKNENIRLIFCGSHAKIMCFRTKENFYVVEGSANLSPNSRIEQVLFENSQQMYEFHKSWIDEIDKIATDATLAVYDYDGKKIKGSNKFKEYAQNSDRERSR